MQKFHLTTSSRTPHEKFSFDTPAAPEREKNSLDQQHQQQIQHGHQQQHQQHATGYTSTSQ
jgi:hypothetical protein